MKRPHLALLFTALALGACQTAHDAAVSTFRVVDAPHQYVRRKLGIDEEPQTTTTTTTTETTYSDSTQPPPPQPYPATQPYGEPPPPPPPVQTERRVTTTAPEPAPESTPPRVTRSERQERAPRKVEPRPSATPRTATLKSEAFPYAKPVPGKPGYVFSPYDPNGGYVDVKGYSPGQKVKDPYSGKIFLVP